MGGIPDRCALASFRYPRHIPTPRRRGIQGCGNNGLECLGVLGSAASPVESEEFPLGQPLFDSAQPDASAGRLAGALKRLRGDGLWLSLLLIAMALVAGWLLPLDSQGEISEDFFLEIPCVFHMVTGLPCPLCGMTRAFANLSRLQISQAAVFSPAGSAIFGFLLCYLLLGWLYVLTGWRALRHWLRRDYFGVLAFITIVGWPLKLWLAAVATP